MTADEALTIHSLPGIEADNLLGLLAALGLLRALEATREEWAPRLSWSEQPWRASVHLARPASQRDIASAAADGVSEIARRFDVKGHKNVGDFDPESFRALLQEKSDDEVAGRLAAALGVEYPRKRQQGIIAGPFVFQRGQGHQHFLERLLAITNDTDRKKASGTKKRVQRPAASTKIFEALFAPWRRDDETDAFRWDPQEDQRYALRYDDPSKAGAAPTVHGANRLAGVGLLSFPSVPRSGERKIITPGTGRDEDDGLCFIWPIWTVPLSLHGIQRLMSHPDVIAGNKTRLLPYGLREILRAKRVPNAKFMNVTRAVPWAGSGSRDPGKSHWVPKA